MPFKTCKGVANASSSTKVRSPVAVKCPRGSSPSPSSSSSSSPPTSGSDCDSSDSDSDSESDESDQEQESPHESSNVKKKEEEVKSDEESDEDEKDEDYKEEEGDSKEEKVSKESRKRKPLTEVVDLRKNLKSMRTDLTRMRRDRNAMYGQLIEIKNLVSNSNSGSTPSITRKEPEVYSGKSCVLCGIKVKFDGVDLNKEIKVVCPECVSYINTKKPRTDGTYNILLFP